MNILVLGSAGRESALAWKIKQSSGIRNLYVAPGNAGTAEFAININLSLINFAEIKDFVIENEINMIVVGPEQPLVDGIYDYFRLDNNFRDFIIIGPAKAAAALEGSKSFAKDFMKRANIPTARYKSFAKGELTQAVDFLKTLQPPYVLKADGLAAGKGVLIPETLQEAKELLSQMLEGDMFGKASSKVVIEEFLKGIELSVFVLTDGDSYKILPSAKDYKRVGEGDTGLNTGGMGAISPVPFAGESFMQKVEERIIKPTLTQLRADKMPYTGFIFIGLMNVYDTDPSEGEPYVIEYNVRMGDPEAEVVIPRIESDLVELFIAMGEKRLKDVEFKISEDTYACVILTAGGYPGDYKSGYEISIDKDIDTSKHHIFHAGTKLSENGKVLSAGGRVIAVSSKGKDIEDALKNVYTIVNKVNYTDMYYRKDIGKDLLCK